MKNIKSIIFNSESFKFDDSNYAKLDQSNTFTNYNTFSQTINFRMEKTLNTRNVLSVKYSDMGTLNCICSDRQQNTETSENWGYAITLQGNGSLNLVGGEVGKNFFDTLSKSETSDKVNIYADSAITFYMKLDDGKNGINPDYKRIAFNTLGFIEVPSSALTPTQSNYLASKKYVDDQINKLKLSLNIN